MKVLLCNSLASATVIHENIWFQSRGVDTARKLQFPSLLSGDNFRPYNRSKTLF